MFSSDIGHWDVPDMAGVVAESFELVDDGLLTPGAVARGRVRQPGRDVPAGEPRLLRRHHTRGLRRMTGEPVFDQVNLVVRDMDAALAFYARLGLAACAPPPVAARYRRPSRARQPDRKRQARRPRQPRDGPHLARRGARRGRGPAERRARLRVAVARGRRRALRRPGRRRLHRAPAALRRVFGARYAIVADPDGNDVGLMSPIDPDRRFVPGE